MHRECQSGEAEPGKKWVGLFQLASSFLQDTSQEPANKWLPPGRPTGRPRALRDFASYTFGYLFNFEFPGVPPTIIRFENVGTQGLVAVCCSKRNPTFHGFLRGGGLFVCCFSTSLLYQLRNLSVPSLPLSYFPKTR